jgi:hypothetical protein
MCTKVVLPTPLGAFIFINSPYQIAGFYSIRLNRGTVIYLLKELE